MSGTLTPKLLHWNWLAKASLLLSLLILAASSIYFLAIWLGYSETWFSPLVVRGAAFIWTPSTQSIGHLLLKSLDWAALDTPDPTKWWEFKPAQRVRPLSDFFQVVDAIARPWISRFYPHPSLTPSALVAGLFTPLFFYLYVRRVSGSTVMAALFAALFISSMGFLSVVVPDIHASAKRLSLLLICVPLYLAVSHESDTRKFVLLVAVLFISLFTDEMALGLYVAFVVICAPWIFTTRAKALAVLGLPLLYLAVTVWVLPPLYAAADARMPPFGAVGDTRKLALFLNLLDPAFYVSALSQTGRAVLITIGISERSVFTVALVLALFIGSSVWLAWRGHRQVAASALALLANGFYLSLLDLYNPEDFYSQVSTYADYNKAMASYTYYYHSSLGILTLLWLMFVCLALAREQFVPKLAPVVAVPVAMVVALNFNAFHNVNQIIMLTHYHPFQSSSLYEKIREVSAQTRGKPSGAVIPVKLQSSCSIVTRKFTRTFAASMGDTWQTNPLNILFQKGAFTDADVRHLFYVHFPQYQFDINIASDGTQCGVPRITVSPADGPPGSSVLISGAGFKAHVEVYFLWDNESGMHLGQTIADSSGKFTNIPIKVPDGAAETHKIFASSFTGLATSAFNITAPAGAFATP